MLRWHWVHVMGRQLGGEMRSFSRFIGECLVLNMLPQSVWHINIQALNASPNYSAGKFLALQTADSCAVMLQAPPVTI